MPDAEGQLEVDEEEPTAEEKLLRQNKLLAMRNSEMAQQISEMESTISSLARDNALLREEVEAAQKPASSNALEVHLDSIEKTLKNNFSGTLLLLQQIREEEGLTETLAPPKLDDVLNSNVATSTPETEGKFFVDFTTEKPTKGENETGISSASSSADLAMMEGETGTEDNVGKQILDDIPGKTVEEVTKKNKRKPFLDFYGEPLAKVKKPSTDAVTSTPTTESKSILIDSLDIEPEKNDKVVAPKKRRALTNITNTRRRMPRKAAVSSYKESDAIFDFVDQDELLAQAKESKLRG